MRRICLDTETTGLYPNKGDRVVEIGCVEVEADGSEARRSFHVYLNPEREMPRDAWLIHGLDDAFLSEKPKFSEVVDSFLDFIAGAELIIHNAPFDVAFLDMELERIGKGVLSDYCPRITDSLAVARSKFPSERNSLDALCDRFGIDRSMRDIHGALLDAELLAKAYTALERVPLGSPGKVQVDHKSETVVSGWSPEEEAELHADFQNFCEGRLEIVLPIGIRRPRVDFSCEFSGVAQRAYVLATSVLNSRENLKEIQGLLDAGQLNATTMAASISEESAHSLLSRIIEALVTIEPADDYYDVYHSQSHMRQVLELFLTHGFSCKERDGRVGAQVLFSLLRFRMSYYLVGHVKQLLDAGADPTVALFHPELGGKLTACAYVERKLKEGQAQGDPFCPECWFVLSRIFLAHAKGIDYSRIGFFHTDGLYDDWRPLAVSLISNEPAQVIRLKKGQYRAYTIEPFRGMLRLKFSRKRTVFLTDRGFAIMDPTWELDSGSSEVDVGEVFGDFIGHMIHRTSRSLDEFGRREFRIRFKDDRELISLGRFLP